MLGTPTRVVLLRNMVGPGEVDPDLEDEVANECSKYGQVQSVMIFEVTTAGYPDDQAVRIFVEFERMEQATKVRCALKLCKPSSVVLFLLRLFPVYQQQQLTLYSSNKMHLWECLWSCIAVVVKL
jgi:hypothetical protein